MVRIRLSRIGRKHLPQYRIVVTPLREKRDSKAIDYIGHYFPLTKEIKVDKEKATYWMSVGAQPSETVKRILIKEKVLEAPKYKRVYNKQPGKKSSERAEAQKAKEEESKAAVVEEKVEEAPAEETPAEESAE